MRRKKSALEIASHFLKFRPRSCFEIERKLKQRKFATDKIKKTIKVLKKNRLLDDLEFAKMWIRNRNQLRPSGRKLLFLELRKLGIDQEICESALAQEDLPETKKARIVFERKKKVLVKLSSGDFRKKMIGFLSRRGFTWETISEVLKK